MVNKSGQENRDHDDADQEITITMKDGRKIVATNDTIYYEKKEEVK